VCIIAKDVFKIAENQEPSKLKDHEKEISSFIST